MMLAYCSTPGASILRGDQEAGCHTPFGHLPGAGITISLIKSGVSGLELSSPGTKDLNTATLGVSYRPF